MSDLAEVLHPGMFKVMRAGGGMRGGREEGIEKKQRQNEQQNERGGKEQKKLNECIMGNLGTGFFLN